MEMGLRPHGFEPKTMFLRLFFVLSPTFSNRSQLRHGMASY
jgi:hypothetical protein